MSKKAETEGTADRWKYRCTCGYETLQIGSAVAHINRNRDHQLMRETL